MIGYDIDGEPVQSEQVRVYKNEGFFSYQTGSAGASLTAEESPDGLSVLFTGPGTNYNETDTSGAVKFTYKNTSIVTLQFETVTASNSPLPNPIFFLLLMVTGILMTLLHQLEALMNLILVMLLIATTP